jgi:hypothetical protein
MFFGCPFEAATDTQFAHSAFFSRRLRVSGGVARARGLARGVCGAVPSHEEDAVHCGEPGVMSSFESERGGELRHRHGRPLKGSSRTDGAARVALVGAHAVALVFGVAGCSADAGNAGEVGSGGSAGFFGSAGSGVVQGNGGVAGVNAAGMAAAPGSGGLNSGGPGGAAGSGGATSSPPFGAGGQSIGNGGGGANAGGTNGTGGGGTGMSGAGGGDADAGTSSGTSACSGGRALVSSDAAGGVGTPVRGYGEVQFQLPTTAQPIVELRTTLLVPAKPTTSSTLFIWPGLEPLPGGTNYNPIGLGVLQPVLTWSTSCAPNSPKSPRGWWISSQYVNVSTRDAAHSGCFGGSAIDVEVGDALDITMSLSGTKWNQVVVDRQSGKMASFEIEMSGQAQDWALFKIEIPTQTKPASDIVFTSTTLTFAGPQPMLCQPTARGASDYFAAPVASMDGTKCCISRIILRAQGVPASSPNTP